MTRDELVELVGAHEWRDVEFKEARRAVPKDAYETVAAFANTEGGHLVFGVRGSGSDMEVVGVQDVDKVQGEFLNTLRQPRKFSVVVEVQEELHRLGDLDVLVFYIPEVSRSQKPVYLNDDIRRAFVRTGGSDVRCSASERNRFLVDAAPERYDSRPVEIDPAKAFDEESLRWYRAVYEAKPGNRSHAEASDLDFLAEMGLLLEQGERRLPTHAAVLLFGTNRALRQLLPRPVVDCQRCSTDRAAADTGERWFDRLVLEDNLVRTWRSLIADWYERFAEHPFRVDPQTLQRDDTPPDYLAFRESMVNLIVHQDYADPSRKAVIRHYADQTVFWNPGDAFAQDADLFEPGEKEVRNPRIVFAFRHIGLGENAGWGLRDVFRNWQQLGNVPPRIDNDKRRKSFEIVLAREQLMSGPQLALRQALGATLTEPQARVFAFASREDEVTLSQIGLVAGVSSEEAVELARRLVTQALFRRVGQGRYALAGHVRDHAATLGQAESSIPGDGEQPSDSGQPVGSGPPRGDGPPSETGLVTDQAAAPKGGLVTAGVTNLTEHQKTIMINCDVPRTRAELMERTGLNHRAFFRRKHLDPLVRAGLIRMTRPEEPTHPDQAYVVTESGLAFLSQFKK